MTLEMDLETEYLVLSSGHLFDNKFPAFKKSLESGVERKVIERVASLSELIFHTQV
jgi:hypothetical protein